MTISLHCHQGHRLLHLVVTHLLHQRDLKLAPTRHIVATMAMFSTKDQQETPRTATAVPRTTESLLQVHIRSNSSRAAAHGHQSVAAVEVTWEQDEKQGIVIAMDHSSLPIFHVEVTAACEVHHHEVPLDQVWAIMVYVDEGGLVS